MQKESGASRWWLWVTVWFYDDIKDIIEICRVAAYLNQSINPTPGSGCGYPLTLGGAGYLYVRSLIWPHPN